MTDFQFEIQRELGGDKYSVDSRLNREGEQVSVRVADHAGNLARFDGWMISIVVGDDSAMVSLYDGSKCIGRTERLRGVMSVIAEYNRQIEAAGFMMTEDEYFELAAS
jgi:hypothetical protein